MRALKLGELFLIVFTLLSSSLFSQNNFGSSLTFDGTNDFVDPNVLYNNLTNDFTIEGWVYPTNTHQIDSESASGNTGTSGQRYMLWPTWYSVDGGIGISVGINGVSVYEHGGTFFNPLLVWSGSMVGWNHLSIVFQNKQPKLYVNGILVRTGLTSTKPNIHPSLGGCGQYPGETGGIGGGTFGYFQGSIDEFRIWNVARTTNEINETMNMSFTCPPSNLIAYYKFDEGMPFANNSNLNYAVDYSANVNIGILNNFDLNWSLSNWTAQGDYLPIPLLNADTSMCMGSSLNLPIPKGITAFTWNPGQLTGTNNVVSPSSTTIYSLTSFSGGTCIAMATFTVNVIQKPTIVPAVSQKEICPGYSIAGSASGAFTYTWEPGNIIGSSMQINLSSTTTFTVYGTGLGGCVSNTTISVSLLNCSLTPINCQSKFYCLDLTSDRIKVIDVNSPGITNTLSIIPPPGSLGITIGPSFGFNAPNPTFWAISSGNYWYYNGSTFINTGHSAGGWNAGSSKNYLYTLGTWGDVYRYNGTGNSVLVSVINSLAYNSFFDITGDDLDNFYVSKYNSLSVFDPTGTQICSYSHPLIYSISTNFGGGLAIVDSMVFLSNGQVGGFFKGKLAGPVINYTVVNYSGSIADFASCPLSTTFVSSIQANGSSTISCFSPSLTLTAKYSNSVGFPVSFSWIGPGLPSPLLSQSIVVTAPGIYTCNLRTCSGGTSVATYTVVNSTSNPVITISSSPLKLCLGATATVSLNNAVTYTWFPTVSLLPTFTVNPSSTAVYSVTGTNSTGCVSNAVFHLIVSSFPTLTISPPSATLCATDNQSLTVVGANSYTWLPVGITGSAVVVSPTTSTSYTIIGEQNSCTSSNTLFLNVNPKTIITPSASNLTVCAGDPTSLTIGTSTLNYIWLPGLLQGQSVIVHPISKTTYSVMVTNQFNCNSSATLAVDVFSTTMIHVSASSNPVCTGLSTTLNASGAATYTWHPLGISSNYITLTPNGNVNQTITATDMNGCLSNTVYLVKIVNSPTITNFVVGSNSFSLCSGSCVSIAAAGAQNYTWNPVAYLSSPHGNIQVASPPTTMIYTITGANGHCTATTTVTLTVYPTPKLITEASTYSICSGTSVTLTANGAETYSWQPLNESKKLAVVSPSNNMQFTVTGTNDYGCRENEIVSIVVTPESFLNIETSPKKSCFGETTTLTARGANSYTWLPSNQNKNKIVVPPSTPETYTLMSEKSGCLVLKTIKVNSLNCDSTALGLSNKAGKPILHDALNYLISFTLILTNSSKVEINHVSVVNDLSKTFISPTAYTLVGIPVLSKKSKLRINPNYNGSSITDITLSETSNIPPHQTDTIIFFVLTNPNGYSGYLFNNSLGEATINNFFAIRDSSENGLNADPDFDHNPTNNNQITTIDIALMDLFIPQGFSPNDDGLYDYFIIKGINDRKFNFTVFNRWGNKVFEQKAHQIVWDGKSNIGNTKDSRDVLPSGTYYFTLEFLDGTGQTLKGYLSLEY